MITSGHILGKQEAIERIRFAKMPPHASAAKEEVVSVAPPVVAMEEPGVVSRDPSQRHVNGKRL